MSFEVYEAFLKEKKSPLFKGYPFSITNIFHSDKALSLRINNLPVDYVDKVRIIRNGTVVLANLLIPIIDFYKLKYPGQKVEADISSFYRCLLLNKEVRGSVTSQHPKGEAIDFNILVNGKKISQKEIFNDLISGRIKNKAGMPLNILLDQCIYEGTWIHISYSQKVRRKMFLNKLQQNVTKELI